MYPKGIWMILSHCVFYNHQKIWNYESSTTKENSRGSCKVSTNKSLTWWGPEVGFQRERDWGLWAAPHPGPHSHGGCPQQSQVWGYRPATWLVSGCARQCPLQSCGLLGKIKIGSIPHLALGLSTQSKAMWGKSKDMLFFSRDWQAHLVATIHSPRENAESHRHSEIQAETAK